MGFSNTRPVWHPKELSIFILDEKFLMVKTIRSLLILELRKTQVVWNLDISQNIEHKRGFLR